MRRLLATAVIPAALVASLVSGGGVASADAARVPPDCTISIGNNGLTSWVYCSELTQRMHWVVDSEGRTTESPFRVRSTLTMPSPVQDHGVYDL
ncbi:hypothetical protein ACFO4E_14440 [Nocardiopsis mangrovi]|uniref:Secreted protein n=1 Tax=Nocardiopsis mangrovi TaxID=1179818 RepID=A0ABV9DWC1_9ACTN